MLVTPTSRPTGSASQRLLPATKLPLDAADTGNEIVVFNKPLKYRHLLETLTELCEVSAATENPAAPRHMIEEHLSMETKTRILLAEDHPVNREVAEYILKCLGYAVDVARNGHEVIEAVQKGNYPLVLMDLRMPEMDGIEAARFINTQIPASRRPFIVAMTADVTREKQKQCREVGMVGFISKPIDKNQLADVLAKYAVGDAPVDTPTTSPAERNPLGGDGAAAPTAHPKPSLN